MQKKVIDYSDGKTHHKGLAIFQEGGQKKAAVLVCHAWHGQDDFTRSKAALLAEMGYVGFAVDMYGEGKEVHSSEEAKLLMTPLVEDRLLTRRRMLAAFEAVKALPEVDPKRIAVIGFCFGGMCALELARSGAAICAAVSFHGRLYRDKQVKSGPIKAAILALHGYEDPLMSAEQLADFQEEMNSAKVDWQLHIYGLTTHAFTNPQANSPEQGLLFQKSSSERSFKEMEMFFKEKLK
jgi:dienelactone hydrolase